MYFHVGYDETLSCSLLTLDETEAKGKCMYNILGLEFALGLLASVRNSNKARVLERTLLVDVLGREE